MKIFRTTWSAAVVAMAALAAVTLLTLAAAAPAAAQTPAPAQAQQALVIRGGTVHTLAAEPVVGDVVIENGRITAVGRSAQAPAGARVINASGLHVYPGMFDAASQLGLTEVGAVDVTVDISEQGDYTPHLQARTAIHPASEHIPVARSNGVTHSMVVPMGRGGSGGFPGQASVVHLDGWTVEEMDVVQGAVMTMDWPTIRRGGGWWSQTPQRSYSQAREDYEKKVHEITQWLNAARDYARSVEGGAQIPRDLRLEALVPVVRGDMQVLIRAQSERDIRNALEFATEQNLRVIIGGGSEAYRLADLLAARDIPVILGPTQAMPNGPDRPYDEAYASPGLLHAAGVRFAIATFNSSDVRTLPYEAAMAVPFGLPRDVALRAITAAPAEILGVGDRLGTIETGKVANLFITDGDPLEITTQVRHLIINGREADAMDRHRELYERYRSRPMPAGRATEAVSGQ